MRRIIFYLAVCSVLLYAPTAQAAYNKTLPAPPPAKLTTWLHGTDGTNALAKVGDPAPVVNRRCLQLDGEGDEIDFGISLSGDFTLTCTVLFDDNDLSQLFSQNGNDGFWLRRNKTVGNVLQLYANGDYAFIGGPSLSVDTWYDFRLSYTASSDLWDVDYKLNSSDTWLDYNSATRAPALGSANLLFGQKGGLQYFKGKACCFTVDSAAAAGLWPVEENSGEDVYDASGNGNPGTINSAVAGVETVRSGRADGVISHNAKHGFVVWTNGTATVRVPYLTDGSAPATNSVAGYAVASTNLGGYVHNNGGYDLLIDGVTNTYAQLWTNSVGVTFGDPIRNAYTYTNAVPSYMTNIVMEVPVYSGSLEVTP